MKNVIVIHFSEIGLKGRNRFFFERKLRENIKKALKDTKHGAVKSVFGRIIVEIEKESDKKKAEEKLKKVFGIANFSFGVEMTREIPNLQEVGFSLLRKKKFSTFRIETTRSDKNYPLTSPEVDRRVGGFVKSQLKTPVDLEHPEASCFIEITPKKAYLYTEKIKGLGGLPVSTAGKIVSLLSGGIDSPVASYQMLKRGARVIFVHFHSYPHTNWASVEKVKEIVEILNEFQFFSRLYLVPLLKIQKEVVLKTKPSLRVVLYRRAMLKIAEKIAQKEKALALVTGDSLGQVASQTLENIKVTGRVVNLPIFRPLIGMDKQEIVDLAKEIETYKISIKPYTDCCSLFIPKRPATKAKIFEVEKEEEKLEVEAMVKKALEKAEVVEIKER